jgi:hypothetical protein
MQSKPRDPLILRIPGEGIVCDLLKRLNDLRVMV